MTGLAAFLGAVSAVAAVVLLVGGLRRRVRRPRPTPIQLGELWARYTRRPAGRAGRRRDIILAVSLAAGLGLAFGTGWLIAIPVVPAAVLVLPKLLGQAPRNDLQLMEALDRWVRNLAVSLPVGRDVVQAIRVSRAGAPPLIADEVALLVDRIDRRVPPDEALQRLADALDSPEADAVIASLKLATVRTEGLRDNLVAIADAVQERIRALREIETERNKPRNVARLVTITSALMIVAAGLSGYLAPYATPTGQLIIAGLGAAYVGSLLIMYRMTVPRRRQRILIARGLT